MATVNSYAPDAGRDFETLCEGLDRLRQQLGDRFCTACRYCMPCPQGIDIPRNMGICREWKVFGLDEHAAKRYAQLTEKQEHAVCNACGRCVDACPNNLDIPSLLRELDAGLGAS